MLIKYKERYSILFRAIALTVVCLFLYNDLAFALAPRLAVTSKEFEGEYLASTVLLTSDKVHAYILSNVNPKLRDTYEGIRYDGVSGLLRNRGQIAQIYLEGNDDLPVIGIDSNYFYNETVRRFERKKIAGLEEIRRRKGFTCKQMAAWIRRHLRTPDPNLGGKTSRQVLDEIHEMAHSECPGIDRLYERIKAKYIKAKERGLTDERQRKRAKSLLNFAEMYAVYRDAGNKLDGDDNDINIAAQKRRAKKAVNSSDKKSAARKLMLLARSMMPRPAGRPTWIGENVPELVGKTILSISLEGNIPEFSNWPRIQNANTRGGLGAYYGDKFEGLDRIGIGENGSGIQPGYMFDKHGNHIDYEELVSAGALKEVKMAEDVEIWTWIAEDCTLSNMINGKDVINGKESWEFFRGWCRQQSHGNALLKVKFYQINRKGAKRYIAVSPVWDRLYTEDRNHRFSQEISFGKAVYEFCKKTNFVPDILHLNEGHAVVAASEMRTDQAFDRTAIVATDHTPVEAGHEKFEGPDLSRMTYILGRGGEAFKEKFIRFKDGRWIVDFSDAVIELADVRNGVAKEHAGVTAKLFEKILKEKTGKDRSINIAPVLNGSGDVWVNEELLKHQAVGSIPSEDDLHKIHEEAKVKYAFKEIEKRTGVKFDPEKPTNWVVRRITEYKSQYPMLRFLVHIMCAERDEVFTEEKLMEIWKRDILTHLESGTDKEIKREKEPFYYKNLQRHMPEILKNIFAGRKQINGLGMQMVVGGPEHEGHWVNEFKRWMELPALKGKFVYVSDSDANLLRMQAIGADICTNMPRDLEEACGTSDQRTGRNGGVTISERGAGPVEWVTDYDIKKKNGSGFMFGPFTKRDNEGRMEADWDRFYTEGPGELLRRTEAASDIFYKEDDRGSPDKQEWKRLMFNSYCASTYGAFISNEGRLIKKKAVTAQAMEERYARDVYLPAILEKSDTKIINEIVVRDYCTYDSEGNIKVTGLKNAAKELEELSKRGVRHISLVGLMKHTGRPYEILNFTELDERAGTWKDWQAFLEETRKWRIKVLGDWLANQHVAKSSRLCDERPETFLYTNVSDGNYRLGFDMSCVRKGRYVPLEELRARIENGKAIVRILQRMKDDDKEIPAHGWLDVGTERNLGYKKEIEYWAADENARNSIMGLEKTHKPVIVKEEDALFLISATDLVATDKDCPRRWSALAQADLSHPDVISGAIGAGRFWLDKGLNGFRIDAALSNFPDRFQDNWGVKLGDNLTVKFMREMRAFNHNCFFLFEGYDRQGELLALADYRNCACYDWKMREYTTAALNDENKVSQLKDYLRDELRRMPKDIAEHLVNVAREHDSFDLNNPVSHLGFQDMNIMLLLYMFTPGFSMIFNGEAYGSSYEYKNDVKESESASRLKDADKDRMMVRQRILGLPRSSKAMISGVYDYLSLREGNALGLVRYDAEDIIIGAANLNSGGWSTFDLKNVIYGQTKISATRPDHYIKTSYKLSADGTQWVQGKSEVKSAEELLSSGLGVNLDKKTCEIVMLKRVAPGTVVMKKPESPDMAKDKRPEPEKQMTRREIRAMIERGISYEEAVEWRRLKVEGGINFPSRFFHSAVTVKNMILVALDTVPGFKKAREEGDIKTMAALYRDNVINYIPKDDKRYHNRYGQTAFFYEAGGLSGLMSNQSQYFSKTNSPASLIRFVLPDLIDPKNPDALDPIEVERDYWTDPENAKYHILRTLDTIPGFKDAREKGDIGKMAALYREYVIRHRARDAEKYGRGGQLTFFFEVGGLSGLMAEKVPYLQKKGSAASLLRFAFPDPQSLIDLTNPDALDPIEVEHDYWTDPENAIYHTLQALDTIPQFKAARERGDIKLMADLYRANVIGYRPKDTKKYVHGGQTAFFFEVGGLSGLLANKRPFLAKTNSPASLIYLSLPGLIDDNNPDALKSREVENIIKGASRRKPESPDMAKEISHAPGHVATFFDLLTGKYKGQSVPLSVLRSEKEAEISGHPIAESTARKDLSKLISAGLVNPPEGDSYRAAITDDNLIKKIFTELSKLKAHTTTEEVQAVAHRFLVSSPSLAPPAPTAERGVGSPMVDPRGLNKLIDYIRKPSNEIDPSELKDRILSIFPELDYSQTSIPHKMTHVLTVIQCFNRLTNRNFEYFYKKLLVRKKGKRFNSKDKPGYVKNLNGLYQLYSDLPQEVKNDLTLAIVLHDIGFTDKNTDDAGHPSKGAELARSILVNANLSEESIDRICDIIKYHDFVGNVVRAKKVPRVLRVLSPESLKLVVIANCMDMAGYGDGKDERVQNNLIPESLEKALEYSDPDRLRRLDENNEYYEYRLRKLARRDYGEELTPEQIGELMAEINKIPDESEKRLFIKNWNSRIEVRSPPFFFKIAHENNIFRPLALVQVLRSFAQAAERYLSENPGADMFIIDSKPSAAEKPRGEGSPAQDDLYKAGLVVTDASEITSKTKEDRLTDEERLIAEEIFAALKEVQELYDHDQHIITSLKKIRGSVGKPAQAAIDELMDALNKEDGEFSYKNPAYQAIVDLVREWPKRQYHAHIGNSIHEGFIWNEMMLHWKEFEENAIQQNKKLRPDQKVALAKMLQDCLDLNQNKLWHELSPETKDNILRMFSRLFSKFALDRKIGVYNAESWKRAVTHVALQHFSDGVRDLRLLINMDRPFFVSTTEAISYTIRGFEEAEKLARGNLSVKLVVSFAREKYNPKMAEKILDEIITLRKDGSKDMTPDIFKERVIGIDISGREAINDRKTSDFKSVIEKAAACGMITMSHLGDWANISAELEESIDELDKDALDKFAPLFIEFSRNGIQDSGPLNAVLHGISLAPEGSTVTKGPGRKNYFAGKSIPISVIKTIKALLKYLNERNIEIMACPTVNVRTQKIVRYREHPLHQWLARDNKVSINVDDFYRKERSTLSDDIAKMMLAAPQESSVKFLSPAVAKDISAARLPVGRDAPQIKGETLPKQDTFLIKHSAKNIVGKLGALQKEFVGRFNSTTNLDVIFSILPEGEEGAYFTACKYGDAVEHEEIKVVHVNGEISGINCVRGELKGDVYGIDPGSCITLELPFLPDGKYREVRGIAHEMELESAINDVIISARILLNGGVPAGKRFIFKADTADRELIELCGAKAGLVKTLGELAAIPLLACKLPPAASANKPESPDMAKDKEVTVSAKRAGELLEIISGDFKKTLNQIAYSTAPKETISRAIDEITGRLSRVTGAGAIEIKQAFMDIVELKRDSRRYYPDLNEKVFGFNKFFAPDGLMVMGGFSQYYGDSLRIGIIDTSKERRLEMPGKKIRVFYITKWLGEPPPFFGVACFGSTDLFINEPSIGIAYDQLSQLCANLLKETGTGKLIPNALSAINELKPVFSRQEVYPQMVEEATIHEMKHLQDTLFMISKFPAASNPEQGFVQAAVKSSGLLHAYASKNKDRSEEISRAVFELSAEMANLYHAPNPKVYIARLFLHLSGKRQLHLELQLFLELFRNEILGDSKNIGSGLSRPEFDHVFAHLMNMSSDDLRQIAEKIYIREFQTPGLDTLQVPAVTKPESPDMAKDKDVISLVDYHIGNAMEALNEGRPYDAELHAKEALSLFRQYDSVRSDPFKLKEFLDLRGVESCFSLEKRATAENILKTIEAAKQARWPALMNKRADRVSLADIEAIRDATIETIICDIKKNGLGLYSPLMLLSSDTSTCGRLATYILNPRFIKSTPLKHRSPMEFEHEVDDYQMDWDSFAGSFWEIDAYPHSLALPEKDGMSKEDRLVIAEELWFDRVIMGMKKVVRERNIRTWLQNLIEDSDELAKRSIQNIVFVMRYESLRKKELPKSRQLLLMDGEFDFLPIDLSEVSYILVPSNLKQSLKKLFGDEYENKIMEVGLVADSDKPSVLVPDYGAALRQIMNKDPGVIYMTHIMRLPTSGDILYAQPYKEDEFSHSQIYTVFLKYFGISLDDKTAFRLALEYKGYFGNNKARWRLRKALSETWPVIPRLLLALIQGDDPIAIPYDLLWRGEQEIAADDGRKFKFVLKTTKGEGYKVEEEFHINVFTKNGSTEERVGYAHASVVHRDGAGKTLLMRYSDDMGFNEDTDFTGASNIRAPAIEVLKKYRDEYGGIGRAMMSLLMQIAQIKQIDNFEIQEADAGAIGFYLKLGFSKLGDNLLFPLSMQSMENAGLSFQALSIDKKIKGPEQKVITSIQSPVPTKTESPDMAKEKEEVYKKTSPAGLLEAIKENDGLMAKALDRNVGIPLEEHAGILQELGIFVPAEGRTGYFRFGDMMVGPKADDTGTFINAINGIIFKFDKIGERKPLHESELLAANIPLVKELIKMAILHEINKIQTAAIPDGKILWHILESGVVSVPQSRFPFAQGFNEEAEKLNTPERLYILKEGETIKEAMERIEKDYSNAIFDVALSDVSHVEDVYALQGKDKIKMLVFEFKEGPGDFSQLGGIMAALRALHGPKEDIIPTLRRIYSVIRGRAYDKEIDPNAIDDNDPRVLARNFIFKNLPPSEKISGDLRRVNEHLLSLLTSA